MNSIKSLLVYCGSAKGNNPVYFEAAQRLGSVLAANKIQLIYGGGSIGLMGVVADAVMKNRGEVVGVIPGFLNVKEVGHGGLTALIEVSSMHERKAKMEELCDAAIALPGGYGTLDELFEILTWSQLGLHKKPIGILNVNRYFNGLIAQLDTMVKEGFLSPANRRLLIESDDVTELLNLLSDFRAESGTKWLERNQT
jgi:uncharacterized protein (TIGR00730 family)